MFALALKKKTLVCEAMSRVADQDCQPFALLISAYADFHELRREKMLALQDILEDYKMDFDEFLEPTRFEHKGFVLFIEGVRWNSGGFGLFDEESGLRWGYDDNLLCYRVEALPEGSHGYFNGGKEPAEALMTHLEKNLVCELCGYLVGSHAVSQDEEVVRKLCRSCAINSSARCGACKTCGLSTGFRRVDNYCWDGEHPECKRRRLGK
jgi:hypothetical protein